MCVVGNNKENFSLHHRSIKTITFLPNQQQKIIFYQKKKKKDRSCSQAGEKNKLKWVHACTSPSLNQNYRLYTYVAVRAGSIKIINV